MKKTKLLLISVICLPLFLTALLLNQCGHDVESPAGNDTILTRYDAWKIEETRKPGEFLVIPWGITQIEDGAFQGMCTQIIVPDTVITLTENTHIHGKESEVGFSYSPFNEAAATYLTDTRGEPCSSTGWYTCYGIEPNSWKTFDNGKTYYFSQVNGLPYMIRNCWCNMDGKIYYFDETGAMTTCWKIINGKWCCFSQDDTEIDDATFPALNAIRSIEEITEEAFSKNAPSHDSETETDPGVFLDKSNIKRPTKDRRLRIQVGLPSTYWQLSLYSVKDEWLEKDPSLHPLYWTDYNLSAVEECQYKNGTIRLYFSEEPDSCIIIRWPLSCREQILIGEPIDPAAEGEQLTPEQNAVPEQDGVYMITAVFGEEVVHWGLLIQDRPEEMRWDL